MMWPPILISFPGQFVRTGSETILNPRVVVISDFNATTDKEPFEGDDRESSSERIKVLVS